MSFLSYFIPNTRKTHVAKRKPARRESTRTSAIRKPVRVETTSASGSLALLRPFNHSRTHFTKIKR